MPARVAHVQVAVVAAGVEAALAQQPVDYVQQPSIVQQRVEGLRVLLDYRHHLLPLFAVEVGAAAHALQRPHERLGVELDLVGVEQLAEDDIAECAEMLELIVRNCDSLLIHSLPPTMNCSGSQTR